MKLRLRKWGEGKSAWQVDYGIVNGRRKMVNFPTKEAAEKALGVATKARRRHGELGVALSPSEMADAMLAREKLNGRASLMEAVDYYLAHGVHGGREIALVDLVDLYTASRQAAGRRVRYVRQLGVSLGSLARALPGVMAHAVTRGQIEAWLHGNGWEAGTRNGYLGDVRAMYNWARKSEAKYVQGNPCEGIEKVDGDDEEIEVLSIADCRRLLACAAGYVTLGRGRREMLGYVVLGLFCGLRPAEMERLSWSQVNLVEGTVIVRGAVAKGRSRRVVDIGAAAVAWLRTLTDEERTGKLCPPGLTEKWQVLRRRAGYLVEGRETGAPWPHDGMRHTYASMHYAMHRDEALLQTQMGHEDKETLFQHYRALCSRADAVEFWGLTPEVVLPVLTS